MRKFNSILTDKLRDNGECGEEVLPDSPNLEVQNFSRSQKVPQRSLGDRVLARNHLRPIERPGLPPAGMPPAGIPPPI